MDFKSYYVNQAGNGLSYFQGTPYQRGYGLGGIFRQIFKWIMPIVKEHALPVAKNVGKELVKTAANVANDSLSGENFKESAKKRFTETIKTLTNQIHDGQGLILNPGLTIKTAKRKLKNKKKISKRKRILDIFDKK